MLRALHLSLILLLCVTGASLAAARGVVRVGGEVQLCAGGAVVTLRLDANGKPVSAPHICPDMALSLMAGTAPVSTTLPARGTGFSPPFWFEATSLNGTSPPHSRARDPPTSVL